MSLNPDGKNLIFLISQPRSGSTLLQLIFSGNPEVATTSEPWIALHPIFALRSTGADSIYNSGFTRGALLTFLKESGVNEEFFKKKIAEFLCSQYNQAIKYIL